ncbi:antibiotic biosynthesis monooxygenase family protein [Pokkaliibacter sp. CJK22405]|uniref:antibiotic biosynthesis monooxygenase family protein n=1 Tax=Pokkaliibacter sp. CJK22405 TaxID=3384615 RepID=UPI0039852236
MSIASTPRPPYYAVIFTSLRTQEDAGYVETAEHMVALAQQQPGYLGMESAREEVGITVSYWRDLEAIRAWKQQVDHQEAQRRGKQDWYQAFKTRIACVERDYGFEAGT